MVINLKKKIIEAGYMFDQGVSYLIYKITGLDKSLGEDSIQGDCLEYDDQLNEYPAGLYYLKQGRGLCLFRLKDKELEMIHTEIYEGDNWYERLWPHIEEELKNAD